MAAKQLPQVPSHAQLRRVFDAVDKDGSGTIDKNEAQQALHEIINTLEGGSALASNFNQLANDELAEMRHEMATMKSELVTAMNSLAKAVDALDNKVDALSAQRAAPVSPIYSATNISRAFRNVD